MADEHIPRGWFGWRWTTHVRLVWLTTFGFLPIYVFVAWWLRSGRAGPFVAWDAPTWAARRPFFVAGAVALGVLAVAWPELGRRLRIPYAQSRLLAWLSAEGLCWLAVIGYVHSGDAVTAAWLAAAYAMLMGWLLPTSKGMARHEGRA